VGPGLTADIHQKKETFEVNMTATLDDEKPWKTDLARRSAQRREQILHSIEQQVKAAPSFEEALSLAVQQLKNRFARFASVTAYVADGEDLVVHTALDRPTGPERVWSGGGPLAEAAQGHLPTLVPDLASKTAWAGVGLAAGSALVAPIRTEAGLWAILEVWSDLRDAFTAQDVRFLEKVTAVLAKKTPAVTP
jgi:putative methionine-R-sulfoxide reductase with GAF domain